MNLSDVQLHQRVRSRRGLPESHYGQGEVVALGQEPLGTPSLVQIRWDDPGLDDSMMYPHEIRLVSDGAD